MKDFKTSTEIREMDGQVEYYVESRDLRRRRSLGDCGRLFSKPFLA